jgi:hypothetical protein
VFLIWSDALPQLSIRQPPDQRQKVKRCQTHTACIDQRIILAYVQIFLNFGAIWFMFHDRINQWPISFQSAISRTAQGDKRFYVSWWSTKLCPNSNKHPRLTQGAYFRSHTRSAYQCVKISQGLPIDVPNHLLYAQRRIQIIRSSWWTFLTISYMRSAAYKSVRGSWLMSLTISYTFYTRITMNKKQGAPDRRYIQLLLLLARTSPHIKSKGLHRYVLQI